MTFEKAAATASPYASPFPPVSLASHPSFRHNHWLRHGIPGLARRDQSNPSTGSDPAPLRRGKTRGFSSTVEILESANSQLNSASFLGQGRHRRFPSQSRVSEEPWNGCVLPPPVDVLTLVAGTSGLVFASAGIPTWSKNQECTGGQYLA